MCYFAYADLKKTHYLKKEDAIVAYKVMNIDHEGQFVSPVRSDVIWNRRQLLNNRHGVYAMTSKRGARAACGGHVLVKVLLWGYVRHYSGGSRSGYYGRSRYPGYMAEHCEIIELYVPNKGRYYYSRWVVDKYLPKLRRRFRKLSIVEAT